jgi:hypothetical protein
MELNKLLEFWFLGLLFCEWGGLLFVWILLCFFACNSHCSGQSSVKN